MNTLPNQIQILFPKIIQIEVRNLYEARYYYQLNGQFEAKNAFSDVYLSLVVPTFLSQGELLR